MFYQLWPSFCRIFCNARQFLLGPLTRQGRRLPNVLATALLVSLLAGCGGGSANPANNATTSANAGQPQSVHVGALVTLDASHSTGAAGKLITYQWTILNLPAGSAATLSDNAASHPTFVPDVAGVYQFRLTVNDGTGTSAPATTTVTVTRANAMPVANPGVDQQVQVGKQVTLDGSSSSDADGDVLSFSWQLTQKPVGSTAQIAGATTVNPRFTPDLAGTYLVSLTVNDGTTNSTPAKLAIVAAYSKVVPVADPGRNQQVPTGTRVFLDGSKSSDADGDLLRYSWSFTSVPVGSTTSLSDVTAVNPSFIPDLAGSYVINLVVTDGEGKSTSAPVTITASQANSVPTADPGADQQVKPAATVNLDGSKSFDADGDLLTFSWFFVSVPAGSQSVLARSTSVTPSFVADISGTYVVGLVVSDGKSLSSQSVVKVVAAQLNSPPVANAGSLQNVSTGSTVTLNGTQSSDADGNVLSYSWSFVSIPAGSQATLVGATTATPSFVADSSGAYVVGLVVNDGTASSAVSTVTVSAARLNSAPVADAGAPQAVASGVIVALDGSKSSDANGDPLTYSWTMSSRPLNSTSSLTGATTVAPTFFADAAGTYTFNLTVSDGQTTSTMATVAVTVQGPVSALTLDMTTSPTVLYNLGTYQVDKITANSIIFGPGAGNITDPILYDSVVNNFNFDNLYRVTTATGKTYYFRFGSQYFTTHTWFELVSWANGLVPTETGPMTFDVVKKDLLQTGQIQIATVGDSITWVNNGEAFRFTFAYHNANLNFIGTHTDTFGFGHEGEGGNTTQDVINRLSRIIASDNYLVHIGTNDRLTPDATLANMQTIAAGLLAKKPGCNVYFLTILPRNDTYDAKNIQINTLMRAWMASANDPRLHLLDVEQDFRNLPNWQTLLPDNLHPCAAGYDLLVPIILSKPGPW